MLQQINVGRTTSGVGLFYYVNQSDVEMCNLNIYVLACQ